MHCDEDRVNQAINLPKLDEPYATALREAVDFVRGRFEVIGIVAAGSIVRGCPHATSDIDLYVVITGTLSQRVQKFFNGVPAEIFANPPEAVDAHLAREQRERRPITAHMLTTGFVVLVCDELQRLRTKAAELIAKPPDVSDEALTAARYMAGNLFEDACDIVDIDPAAADLLLSQAIQEMLQYEILRQGLFYPRSKDLVRRIEEINPPAGALARAFSAAPELKARLAIATQLADAVLHVRGFFEWESSSVKLF
jgi:predicted nucleotidyltransferase